MAAGDQERAGELRILLEQLLLAKDEEAADDCHDNYVRWVRGSILVASGEPETQLKIGEWESYPPIGSSQPECPQAWLN